ncbi:MAG: R3H domain-containing nucleic acid-binding protein [Candidatus Jorgensenbacteria bacterium]|nr:R3H domain-containing nucleic acid-binding protein [Candidatus Jorgensenbacteria bacterium]
MNEIHTKTKKLLDLIGFGGANISIDEEHRKISIFVDDEIIKENISVILQTFDHLLNLMLRREGDRMFVVDLNNYRKERERIIADLARAAAHKAMLTKADVELPPMNAYERRLVHMEIASHPELKTESIGVGKDRRTVIKHIVNS